MFYITRNLMNNKKMKVRDIVDEINYFCQHSEPQTEEQLLILEKHYIQMFQFYCKTVPSFELNEKGQIKLLGY